jgi:hypothetical protein
MSQVTEFYKGTGTDHVGRTLADIWAYSDAELESIHDFIQWLFPLREPSQFNRDGPLLTDNDISEFRADPVLRENLLRSFDVFLTFLGLRYEDGRVMKAADFVGKDEVWRYPNHNWLRMTRVLTSTRLLGLEDRSRAFFEFLKDLRDSGRSGITDDSYRFWERAAKG